MVLVPCYHRPLVPTTHGHTTLLLCPGPSHIPTLDGLVYTQVSLGSHCTCPCPYPIHVHTPHYVELLPPIHMPLFLPHTHLHLDLTCNYTHTHTHTHTHHLPLQVPRTYYTVTHLPSFLHMVPVDHTLGSGSYCPPGLVLPHHTYTHTPFGSHIHTWVTWFLYLDRFLPILHFTVCLWFWFTHHHTPTHAHTTTTHYLPGFFSHVPQVLHCTHCTHAVCTVPHFHTAFAPHHTAATHTASRGPLHHHTLCNFALPACLRTHHTLHYLLPSHLPPPILAPHCVTCSLPAFSPPADLLLFVTQVHARHAPAHAACTGFHSRTVLHTRTLRYVSPNTTALHALFATFTLCTFYTHFTAFLDTHHTPSVPPHRFLMPHLHMDHTILVYTVCTYCTFTFPHYFLPTVGSFTIHLLLHLALFCTSWLYTLLVGWI